MRLALRWLIAFLFFAGGVTHLYAPDNFLLITPDWVPLPRAIILASGVFEIVAALALLTRSWRYAAGIALALYTLAVWPANIKHAIEGIDLPPIPNSWWYHGPRLALQPAIMWMALYAGEVIDWPWRASHRSDGADSQRSMP